MPYYNEVETPNVVGNFFAGRRARMQDDTAQMRMQRERQLNALAQNPATTPEQFVRAGDVQTGAALSNIQSQQQQDKQAALGQLASIAQKALTIADPAQRKGFLSQAAQVYGSAFSAFGANPQQGLSELQALPDAELQSRLQQVAQFAAPQKPIEVAKGGSLVLPDGSGGYKAAFTSPDSENGFTLSPGQVRYGPDGKPLASAPKDTATSPNEMFDRAAKLRQEFWNQSKEFVGVADSYQRIKDSARDPSAAGDLSLIFNYMKVLDPGSTVREGEFATAQNAGGVDERIYGLYNRIINGERLAPAQRADFVDRATKLYKGQEDRFNTRVKSRFEGLAKRYGLDPNEVTTDPRAAIETAPGEVPVPTATGPNGEKLYLRNGQWVPR